MQLDTSSSSSTGRVEELKHGKSGETERRHGEDDGLVGLLVQGGRQTRPELQTDFNEHHVQSEPLLFFPTSTSLKSN